MPGVLVVLLQIQLLAAGALATLLMLWKLLRRRRSRAKMAQDAE